MSLIDNIKKFLKTSLVHEDVSTDSRIVKTPIINVTATNIESVKKYYTEEYLNSCTKLELEEIGRSSFGVDLNNRHRKSYLIDQLLKIQSKL